MPRPFATAVTLGLAFAAPAAADPPAPLYLDRPDPGPLGHWQVDVIAGLPTVARVQWRVLDTPLWLEGGGGSFFIMGTAFAGLRADTGWEITGRHFLAVRPGLDVYYLGAGSLGDLGEWGASGAGALDVDFVWRARWTDGLAGEIGVKLGFLILPRNTGAFPVPIGGLMLGVRF